MGIRLATPLVFAAALCTLGLGHKTVQAQPGSGPSVADVDAAQGRYLDGEKHYAAGRYELAVKEFKAALALSSRPALHFNIANCYERAGEYASAATELQAFLDSGTAPEAEIIRERIWRLQQRAKEQQTKLDKLVDERSKELVEERTEELRTQIQEQSVKDATPPPPKGEAPSYVPSYIVLASGSAALVGGLIFAGISQSAGNDASANCTQTVCSVAAKDALERETRYARAADVSSLIGLAALGVGGYLWYRTSREEKQWSMQLAPMGQSESLGVFVDARF